MRRSDAGRLLAVVVVAAVVVSGAWVLRMLVRDVELSVEDIVAAFDPNAMPEGLEVAYPRDGTLFPPEIVAPTFRWRSGGSQAWLVDVNLGPSAVVQAVCYSPRWKPSADVWEHIKSRCVDRSAVVTIIGVTLTRPPRIVAGARFAIRTSGDRVDAPIFYREVNLPFIDAVKDPSMIRWRFGSIADEQAPPIVLTGLPVCGSCHSFSADGTLLGMDVDYSNDKGSYAIADVNEEMVLTDDAIITWSDYRRSDGVETFGLLSQVSPDGRYVISTVKDKSVFVPRPDLAFSQLFFPFQGILCVYDRQTGAFASLPGADDPNYVQSNATWSPDGQTLVFARSRSYELNTPVTRGKVLLSPEDCNEFLRDGKPFLFDLYRIEFNDGAGGIPQPLKGASDNAKSNFFPKYSPDGRWIVFCRATSYMLLQPDSELYIIPAEGGVARRLECNTDRMNSWHSFSPNGRWLVFSSKHNTPYTQLFLAHIDEQGRSSPPVLLEHFTAADRAANIPEFVNTRATAIRHIRESFLDSYSYVRAAREFLRAADYDAAAEALKKALRLDPGNCEARFHTAHICERRGDLEEAASHLMEVIRLDPNYPDAHYNLGLAMLRLSRLDEAVGYLRQAVAADPNRPATHTNLGAALLMRGESDAAITALNEAVRLDPNYADAWHNLGQAMLQRKQRPQAITCWLKVLALRPNDVHTHHHVATVLAMEGNATAAAEHYDKAVGLDSSIDKSPILPQIIAAKFAEQRRFSEAARYEARALRIAKAAGDEAFVKSSAQRLETYRKLSGSAAGGQ